MRIGIPVETKSGETRVAATPETIKKYIAGKHQVVVQAGAGIVYDSDPQSEYHECVAKARGMLRAAEETIG